MNCFVHLGFDPVPRAVNSPEKAITLAEAVLKAESEEEPDSKFIIQWRRDEFYPNNFFDYTIKNLQEELQKTGSVVLQLVKSNDELPILGDSVTIFTEEIEKQYTEQAETALEIGEESFNKTPIDLHGESVLKRRTKSRKK